MLSEGAPRPRHVRDHEQKATIQFASSHTSAVVRVAEVNGPGPEATNSFAKPDAVSVRKHPMDLGRSGFEYPFPAHSITLPQLDLA